MTCLQPVNAIPMVVNSDTMVYMYEASVPCNGSHYKYCYHFMPIFSVLYQLREEETCQKFY